MYLKNQIDNLSKVHFMMVDTWDKLHQDPRYRPQYPQDQVVRWFFRNFKKPNNQNFKLLDLGCGAGRHALFFASNNIETYASDISKIGVEELSKSALNSKLVIKTQVASADNLSAYDNNFFDGICCFGVLYYLNLSSAQTAIREIHRVLKPQGKLLLIVRTTDDSRCVEKNKVGKNTWRLQLESENAPSLAEQGMNMLFFDFDDLNELLSEFFEIEINRMTFQSGSFADDDWVVYCTKK